MEAINVPAIRALRPAWSKGRIVGQKRPLKPKHVWAIRVRLELAEMPWLSQRLLKSKNLDRCCRWP